MKKATVTYTGILNGRARNRFFAKDGQFEASSGIDPDLALSAETSPLGCAFPCSMTKFSGANVNAPVVALITCPKTTKTYLVLSNGRLISYDNNLGSETLIGAVAGAQASGATYYNNYIYIFGTSNQINYNTQTGNFTVGQIITGASSGAVGTIVADVDGGTTGHLTLKAITGVFTANETITDPVTGSAKFVSYVSNGDGDVARYGPLSDTPALTNNWWTGLTLTSLNNAAYPSVRSVYYPNHVGFVHTDDSLYFTDFKNGQGLLHRIHTKKGTYEGDTDDTTVPSAYNVLDLPFGYYPTALASYSTYVAITSVQTTSSTVHQGSSSLFIWNPTNTESFDQMITLPDPIASALVVRNGVLHVFTGSVLGGFRVSTYSGGDTVSEAVAVADGCPPFFGAVEVDGRRLLAGSFNMKPHETSCVWALGSNASGLNTDLQNIVSVGTNVADKESVVTSLKIQARTSTPNNSQLLVAMKSTTDGYAVYKRGSAVQASFSLPTAVIGRRFKIDEIHVPLGSAVASGTLIEPKVTYDLGSEETTLTSISNGNYPGRYKVEYVNGELPAVGNNSFQLTFTSSGTVATPVAFPITVKLTVYDD
jgi:hypothetical protein